MKYLAIIIGFVCFSCVRTEEIMEAKSVVVELLDSVSCDSIKIKIENGSVESLENCLYRLNFYKTRGGKTKLFGRTIKNDGPEIINEVKFFNGSKIIKKTNYLEMCNFSKQKRNNDLIYFLSVND